MKCLGKRLMTQENVKNIHVEKRFNSPSAHTHIMALPREVILIWKSSPISTINYFDILYVRFPEFLIRICYILKTCVLSENGPEYCEVQITVVA